MTDISIILNVFSEHPLWFIVPITLIVLAIIVCVFDSIDKIITARARHKNIAAGGWPPAHVDADGDAVDVDKDLANIEVKDLYKVINYLEGEEELDSQTVEELREVLRRNGH